MGKQQLTVNNSGVQYKSWTCPNCLCLSVQSVWSATKGESARPLVGGPGIAELLKHVTYNPAKKKNWWHAGWPGG